ncbi:MAG: DUF2062 domain-containing protein [Myxococcales bacterium]|nr:MAG: DUF2062 domain-containing protein [Myxococcales bacterium]
MNARDLWRRLQQIVIHNVLHLDDTPHRIAWGVFIGAIIAFTPTLGLQILIYIAVATLLGANKLSGIPILFVSNPFTAVPLYYMTWKIGAAVMQPDKEITRATIKEWLGNTGRALKDDGIGRLLEAEFWKEAGRLLASTGAELWVGGLLCGIVVALPVYFLTRWGINAVRHLREARRLPHGPMDR